MQSIGENASTFKVNIFISFSFSCFSKYCASWNENTFQSTTILISSASQLGKNIHLAIGMPPF
jgi:hypothetical protein